MATESPPVSTLDLVTHTIQDLTQTTDEPEDKFLEDVERRIVLLQKDLPLHQAASGSEHEDLFWSAVRQFEESGEHSDPKHYIHGKGFRVLIDRLQDVQAEMIAKMEAVSAPIDPTLPKRITSEPKRDHLVDILVDKRVFLPYKDVQAEDRYSESDIVSAFDKVTEADLIKIAQESGFRVAEGTPRGDIIRVLQRELNSDRDLNRRFLSAVPDSAAPKIQDEEKIPEPKPAIDVRTGVAPTAAFSTSSLLSPPPKKGALPGERITHAVLTGSDKAQMDKIRRIASQLVNTDYQSADHFIAGTSRQYTTKDVLGFQYLQHGIQRRHEIEKMVANTMTVGQSPQQRAETMQRLKHNRAFRDMQNDIAALYINTIAEEIADAKSLRIRLEPESRENANKYMQDIERLPISFPILKRVRKQHIKRDPTNKYPLTNNIKAQDFFRGVNEVGGLFRERANQLSDGRTSNYFMLEKSQLQKAYTQFHAKHPNVDTRTNPLWLMDRFHVPAIQFLTKHLGTDIKPTEVAALQQTPDPNKLHDKESEQEVSPATPIATKTPPAPTKSPFAEQPKQDEKKILERFDREMEEIRGEDPMEIMEHWEAASIELSEKFGKSVDYYRKSRADLPMSWDEYEKRDKERGFKSPPPKPHHDPKTPFETETRAQSPHVRPPSRRRPDRTPSPEPVPTTPYESPVPASPKLDLDKPPTPFRPKLRTKLTEQEISDTQSGAAAFIQNGGTLDDWIYKVLHRFRHSRIDKRIVESFAGIGFQQGQLVLANIKSQTKTKAILLPEGPGGAHVRGPGGARIEASVADPAPSAAVVIDRQPERPPDDPTSLAYTRLPEEKRREAFSLFFEPPDSLDREQDWLLQAATSYWESRQRDESSDFIFDDSVTAWERQQIMEKQILEKVVGRGAHFGDLTEEERRVVSIAYHDNQNRLEWGGDDGDEMRKRLSKFVRVSGELYKAYQHRRGALPGDDMKEEPDEKKEEPERPRPRQRRRAARPISIHDEDVMGYGPLRARRGGRGSRDRGSPRRIAADVRRHYRNSVIADHGFGMYEPPPTLMESMRSYTQPFRGYVHSPATGRVAPYARVHLVKMANIAGPTHFMQQLAADANMGQRKVESMTRKGPFGTKGRYRVMARSAHVKYTKRLGVIEITIQRGVRPTELDVLLGKLGAHRHSVEQSICTLVVNRKKRKLGNLKNVDLNKLRTEIETILMSRRVVGITLTDIKGRGVLHRKHKPEMHYK